MWDVHFLRSLLVATDILRFIRKESLREIVRKHNPKEMGQGEVQEQEPARANLIIQYQDRHNWLRQIAWYFWTTTKKAIKTVSPNWSPGRIYSLQLISLV